MPSFFSRLMTLICFPMTINSFLTNRNLNISPQKSVEEAKVVTEVESHFRSCIDDLLPELHHLPLRGLEFLVFDPNFSL